MSENPVYLSNSCAEEILKRLKTELPPEKMNNVSTSMSNIYKKCPGGGENFLYIQCEKGAVTKVETGTGEPLALEEIS